MKNIRRSIIICAVLVMVTGTLMHFAYDFFGNNRLVGMIAPVNESTWEHMKLIFFPGLIAQIVLYYMYKGTYPHISYILSLGTLAGTLSIPVMFYTYKGVLGYGVQWIDVTIFFIAVILCYLIIFKKYSCHMPDWIGYILLFLMFAMILMFFIFTYNPPVLGIFADPLAQ